MAYMECLGTYIAAFFAAIVYIAICSLDINKAILVGSC